MILKLKYFVNFRIKEDHFKFKQIINCINQISKIILIIINSLILHIKEQKNFHPSKIKI